LSSQYLTKYGLPEPGEEALLHSRKMLDAIRRGIHESGGRLGFQQYMDVALFEPELGYYRCGAEKFGALGDFITGPESSTLFGQCLARFCQQSGVAETIMEVGAGSGRLAVSILKSLEENSALPETYFILELSNELRERQRQAIHDALPGFIDRVVWLDTLPEKFIGVVIANELLDAMPVIRFRLEAGKVLEEFVVSDEGGLAFVYEPTNNTRLLARIEELRQQTAIDEADVYDSEVNFVAEDWIKSLADSMQSGVVVIIDYGYPRNVYYHAQRHMGTLMCHYQHRAHPDPLLFPGIQDITAHIDFTAMADAALEANMEVAGFATQAHFLLNLGLLELLDNQQEDLPAYLSSSSEVKRLTLPGEMGEAFKVMVLTKNFQADVAGFEQHDIRHLL
jgi:SAM-dependent MidA family methyltransferase